MFLMNKVVGPPSFLFRS
uniref:Uncharacterized protein n=1 Tax=Anguilla anguilla TaxID=7936 RepID=A0A0E9TLG8_ANGAN